jgi:putative spermidine/putrescine transport system ATP-binding protein
MSLDVDLAGIDLTLGGNRILDHVDLSVSSGSFVTILGPSGSGKSTTLNVVAGFLEPDHGTVSFGGTDVTRVPPGGRRLGIVFQNYAIFPHLTVGENVKFPLVAQRVRGDRDQRVREMLELVKLGGFEDRRASTMSGGQLQRVALARALAAQPQVLLLDEPLSALDKQLREDMQSELKSIQREVGVTTISVTHDQSEALSMSDQVVVMNAGRIEQQGSPEDMYGKPATEFLARFLGEVNLLPVDAAGSCRLLGVQDTAHAQRLLVVRPEDLRIDRDGTARTSFDARVESVQFQGGSVRLEVSAPYADQPLVVREAYAGYGSAARPGDTVRLGFHHSFLHSVERAA